MNRFCVAKVQTSVFYFEVIHICRLIFKEINNFRLKYSSISCVRKIMKVKQVSTLTSGMLAVVNIRLITFDR